MDKIWIRFFTGAILAGWAATTASADMYPLVELSPFTVFAGSGQSPVHTDGGLTDRMAREVRVDLQSRGGSRYQTDITVRGGIFEGTGLMVGGMALFDPQTGHYFSEIPLDPAFFNGASLVTGVENGLRGFNSTAGSIDWQWAGLQPGGEVFGILGSDSHLGGGLRSAGRAGQLGYEVALSREKGDGSVAMGDFDLKRVSGRLERTVGPGLLRVFGGYLDKFYGWPGMYTGLELNETDAYTVRLLGWQYEQGRAGIGGWHRVGGYWRRISDDYEFMRESPNQAFEHQTEVVSLQGDGGMEWEGLDLRYRWVWLRDRIIRSTSLVHGGFKEREYGEGGILGRRTIRTGWGEWSVQGGAAFATSSEDSTVGQPQLGVHFAGESGDFSWQSHIEFSGSSQVPGYTVLNSAENGLFGGNRELGREMAETLEAGWSWRSGPVSGHIVVFRRDDTDLVDWVYTLEAANSRSAAAVDLEVTGLEGWFRWEGQAGAIEIGYGWLHKEAEYAGVAADASFYVLNYARHRVMATLERRISRNLSGRLTMEYRDHPENALRDGPDEALYLGAEAVWENCFREGWDLVLRGYNLTGEGFQPLPGTPGPGREGSLTIVYGW